MKLLLKSLSLINRIHNAALCSPVKSCILFCFLFLNLEAQTNLVPNPSFETYTQCPTTDRQIFYASPWTGSKNGAIYLNSCSPTANVPGCCGYFQYAKTGNAFGAVYNENIYGNNYRDYLQVKLTAPLIKDLCYYVSFYTNLANFSQKALNNVAANLSDNLVLSTGTGDILSLIANVVSYGNPIIKDTINWIKVSSIYKANGGEQYLTIGNFMDDSHTDTLYVFNQDGYDGSLYYIDDVSVIEIDNTFKPTWTYRDTSIIQGDSVFIGTRTNGLKSIWYENGKIIGDSVPGLYVRPQVTTSYVVKEIIPCGNTRLDTVTVTVIPDPVAISVSVKKTCFGEQNGIATVAVTSGIQPFSYKWSNGTQTAQATGLSAGTYTVTVTDKHTNTATASVVVLENPKLQATLSIIDPTSGNNGAATVNVTGGTKPYTYLWSNGKTTKTISSLTNKTYYVTVTDSNLCVLKDTVPVGDVSAINGVVNQSENLNIYPNPITSACGGGILTIESAEKIEQVEIFNVLGIKIFSLANAKNIDVSGFEKGIYFLKLKIKNAEILKRIVIQ